MQQDERLAKVFNRIMALALAFSAAMILWQAVILLRQRCLSGGAHEGEV